LRARWSLLWLLAAWSCGPDLEPLHLRLPDAGPDAAAADATLDSADSAVFDDTGTGAAAVDASSLLAAAFKGYELYAWSADGRLHFSLIVGTNRQKSLEEIMGRGSPVAGELAPIQGVGSVALSTLLMRVPQGTAVIFTSLPGLPPLGAEERSTVERLVAHGGNP
jgi:hypothetical protein